MNMRLYKQVWDASCEHEAVGLIHCIFGNKPYRDEPLVLSLFFIYSLIQLMEGFKEMIFVGAILMWFR